MKKINIAGRDWELNIFEDTNFISALWEIDVKYHKRTIKVITNCSKERSKTAVKTAILQALQQTINERNSYFFEKGVNEDTVAAHWEELNKLFAELDILNKEGV